MALPNEGVNGSDSQADEQVDQQAPDEQNSDDQGGQDEEQREQRRVNSIPHDRVEEMITKRLEKERSRWETEHLSPLKKQYEDTMGKLTQGQLAFLEKMGWYQPEQPKPLTRDEFEKALASQKQEFQQQQVQAYHAQRINEGWRSVSAKFPKLAKVKYFQNAVLAEYAENPSRDFSEIADEAAQQFQAHAAAVQRTEQDKRMEPHRRVVPSGRGGGGGGGKGEKKLSVAEKIRARLKGDDE